MALEHFGLDHVTPGKRRPARRADCSSASKVPVVAGDPRFLKSNPLAGIGRAAIFHSDNGSAALRMPMSGLW